MYCPKCGKADQKTDTYCRQCGEFLPDLTKNNNLAFGGNTPEKQIKTNLFLNLLSAMVSICSALTLYLMVWLKFENSSILLVVAAFLLAMSGWQFSTLAVGLKLKKSFAKRKDSQCPEKAPTFQNQFKPAETNQLLREADINDFVPPSIIENTTKHLSEKVPRQPS